VAKLPTLAKLPYPPLPSPYSYFLRESPRIVTLALPWC